MDFLKLTECVIEKERIMSKLILGTGGSTPTVISICSNDIEAVNIVAMEKGNSVYAIDTDNSLETAIKGLFVAGDGPGVAGNIVSAAATALLPAKKIIGG
jgi:hypothetical protein